MPPPDLPVPTDSRTPEKRAFSGALIQAAFGPDRPSEEVHRQIIAFAGAAAPNTLRALLADLKLADDFQRRASRPALPVSPAEVYLMIREQAAAGKAKATIDRLVASLVRLHALLQMPPPVDQTVRWALREIRKNDTRPVRQARGLRLKGEVADFITEPPEAVSLLALLDSIPADPAGLRDRALLSCGYDAGLRRSELVRVRIEQLERLANGEASLLIPRSKTDQEGEGTRVWLSARSVAHLDAWLDSAGLDQGFIFRPLSYRVGTAGHLSEGTVAKILKRRLAAALEPVVAQGIMQPTEAAKLVAATSAHSLRVGCDQDLMAAGVDIGSIMQGLRWKSPKQPLAYARHLAPATSKLAAAMRSVR